MKLININVGIKIDNSEKIGNFLRQYNADIIALQEVVRHLDDSVFDEYQSKTKIENILGNVYPYKFFGPLWITDAHWKEGAKTRDFGGLIEQGNEMKKSILAIASILKNQGVGFITMKDGEGERIDEKTGRLFTYYKEDEFREVLESAGFSVLEVGRRNTEKDNWLIFYVKKV